MSSSPSRAWRFLRESGAEGRRFLRSAAVRRAYGAWLGRVPEALVQAPRVLRAASGETLAFYLDRWAQRRASEPALLSEGLSWSWFELAQRVAFAAHRFADAGVTSGDVVALTGASGPAYYVSLLGAMKLGASAALMPSAATDAGLRHGVSVSDARYVVGEVRARALFDARTTLPFPNGRAELAPSARRNVRETCVFIFTSGTTGLPKACPITHGKASAAAIFAGASGWRYMPGDRLYNVLPLSHASGLLLGAFAALAHGVPMFVRPFSASRFVDDAVRHRLTAFNYIGETARYLIRSLNGHAPPNPLRVAMGNGLPRELWKPLRAGLGLDSIVEFYGATEAPGGFINLSEEPGSIGHRSFPQLGLSRVVREADGKLARRAGRVIECAAGEPGELILRLPPRALGSAALNAVFRGYTDEAATEKKIVRDCFRAGDRYFRTGDRVVVDEQGFVRFVDRLGDGYRFKGENISAAEVEAEARASIDAPCVVVGAALPGVDGRVGLLVVEGEPSSKVLAALTDAAFAVHARPRFVRFVDAIPTTSTFKIRRAQLRDEGVGPSGDAFVWHGKGYEPLDASIYAAIREGRRRL
ncbi:MAG: AMP-binding protein [Myxococcota bacterium]